MNVNQISGTRNHTAGNASPAVAQSSGGSFREVYQTTALGGQQSMDEIFAEAAATYGVPVKLVKAVAKAESDFNPNATSHAGAAGVMQLMPATARGLGVKNIYDPRENIFGGTRYLKERLDEFDGNVELALAAYNAGSGAVRKYGGIPPYKETQDYVRKIMGFLGLDGELSSGRMVSTTPRTSGTLNSINSAYGAGPGTFRSYGIYGSHGACQTCGAPIGCGQMGAGMGGMNMYSLLSGNMDKDQSYYMMEFLKLQIQMAMSRISGSWNESSTTFL